MQNISQNSNVNNNKKKTNKIKKDILLYNTQIFFFIINICFFIYCEYYDILYSSFSINVFSIFYKKQFYRIITHHFTHYGFGHILINFIIISFSGIIIEEIIGTFYSFYIMFCLIILSSIIYLFFCVFLKFIFSNNYLSYNFDFLSNLGMNSLIWSLITYNFCFTYKELLIKYYSFYIIYFIISNSYFGNISGILSGFIIFYLKKLILPNIKAVKDFETKFNLNNYSQYINIISQNKRMKNCLNEIFGNENKDNLINEGIELKNINYNESFIENNENEF